jgi:hypothetical protein
MISPNRPDVASVMADTWNQANGQSCPADPVDMWPCCQILAEAGLVIGQQEDLAAIAIGPFRFATVRNENPTRDFVEVLFPAAVAALPASRPVVAAVSGVLSAACLVFVKLLDRGVVFHRTPEDVERWTVLMQIANCNANGAFPTICDVINETARATSWNIRPAAAEDAVAWLKERGLVSATLRATGGLEAGV